MKTANFALRSDVKQAWLDALRSGDYKQTKYYLRDAADGRFCCLGVLCRVQHPSDDINKLNYVQMPNELYSEYLALDGAPSCFDPERKLMTPLNEMNDDYGYSFNKIADIIERSVPTFTTDPTQLTWPEEG